MQLDKEAVLQSTQDKLRPKGTHHAMHSGDCLIHALKN
jgi:hypothetical protein